MVSSLVKDVVENYSDIVRLARTPEEYVAAVRAALTEDNSERIRKGVARAGEKTWDAVVEQMTALLAEAEARSRR